MYCKSTRWNASIDLFGKDNPYLENGESETAEEAKKKKESGSSYNVRQSKIAIGSGRIFGKGILKATQTRFDFVPEQRTDFIFCTLSLVLWEVWYCWLTSVVTVAERQRSTFSRCYAYGVAAVFFFLLLLMWP
jgi:rod shape determining protein RodA